MVCFLQEVRPWTALRRISGAPGKPRADPAAAGGPAPCHAPERQQLGARKNRTGFADADRAGGGFRNRRRLASGGSRKTGLSAPAKTLRDRLCCLRGLASGGSGLELGLFAYWRKLLLHDYSPALYAALWKLFVPPLLWYASGVGAVCFFAMWSPVRCGKQARLALLLAALALGLPVLALMAQYLAVALGNLDGVRVWLAPLLRRPAGRTCDSDHSAGAERRLHRAFCLFGKERLKWAFGFSCWQ